MPSWREAFLYFLFLGFVNVGAPVAQITMMFNHMVEKRHFILLLAGLVNLFKEKGWPRPKQTSSLLQVAIAAVIVLAALTESRLFQNAWLFFKTGLLSFGGAYASIVFVQRGAVAAYSAG